MKKIWQHYNLMQKYCQVNLLLLNFPINKTIINSLIQRAFNTLLTTEPTQTIRARMNIILAINPAVPSNFQHSFH